MQHTLPFYKYHGTGNDFILFDNRNLEIPIFKPEIIQQICHRRFGIGADGVMWLQPKEGYDFEMVYVNSDGRFTSMCGNGGRCIVALAKRLGLFTEDTRFLAIDGEHIGKVLPNGRVALQMHDVHDIEVGENFHLLDTGSPHYVEFWKDVANYNIVPHAQKIRYNARFKEEGVNVNLIEKLSDGQLHVATYERGVEDETYSCGTGVVAAAMVLVASEKRAAGVYNIPIFTKGGTLIIHLDYLPSKGFSNVWLEGPAVLAFEGTITVEY